MPLCSYASSGNNNHSTKNRSTSLFVRFSLGSVAAGILRFFALAGRRGRKIKCNKDHLFVNRTQQQQQQRRAGRNGKSQSTLCRFVKVCPSRSLSQSQRYVSWERHKLLLLFRRIHLTDDDSVVFPLQTLVVKLLHLAINSVNDFLNSIRHRWAHSKLNEISVLSATFN